MTFSSSMNEVIVDDLGLGPLGLDPADGGDAVHVRHEQVHQHHVGLQPAGHRHALGAVGGLADDLDVGLQVEEGPQAHPDDRVVIDEQHPDLGSVVHVGSWRDRAARGIGGGDQRLRF